MEQRFLRLVTRSLPIMALFLLLSLMSSPTEANDTLPANAANPLDAASFMLPNRSSEHSDRLNRPLLQAGGPEFQEFQSIPTNGARDWEHFTIGGVPYLAVANHHNDSTYNIDSKVYQWNGTSFVEFQSIPTNGARDWESFTIGGVPYLAVANHHNDSTYNIDSKVYQWNGTSFVEFQPIPTNGAWDWEYFTIGSEHYLAVANYYNDSTRNIDSKVYQWDGASFVEFQSIPTNGAWDWEYFTIGNEHYLVVANYHNNSTYNIDSKVYQWDGASFVEFQSIPTSGAADWQYFTIGNERYLAVANNHNESTRNLDSKLYQWDGASFVEFQSIPTNGAWDWEHFTIGSEHYLAVANYYNDSTRNIESKLYQWDGASFVEFQSIPTNGAWDWEYFTIGREPYLAVANYNNDSTRNIDSKIYKLPTLLSLYALSLDTDPMMGDLSWAENPTLEGIREATVGAPHKRAVVLLDRQGDGNTLIYVVQDGVVSEVTGLPDGSGLLSGAIQEYDMTDGGTLGGFLLWARNEYVADKVTFSFLGHGGPLVPETDYDLVFDPNRPGGSGTITPDNPFPLPLRADNYPSFTDVTPSRKLLSVHQLSEAVRIGTAEGSNPFDVLDVMHCFSSTIEEYYALYPYAEVMTGAPNYAYFAPPMMGRALTAMEPSMSARDLADAIIGAYDGLLAEYDDPLTPADDHPRLAVAVDSTQIPLIKAQWDEVSYQIAQSFDAGQLESAYLDSPKYDTTYDMPQDWQLDTGDGLVDMRPFATQLGQGFGGAVSTAVDDLLPLIDGAIVARYASNGSPWYAYVTPPPAWDFTNHAGIGLYADLVGQEIDGQTVIGWQSRWYTAGNSTGDNAHPFSFLQGAAQGVSWADVLRQFWQGKEVQTIADLPDFPPVPSQNYLDCGTQELYPGDTVSCEVIINGQQVYGVQSTCTNNPTALTLQDATFGDFLTSEPHLIGSNALDAAAGSWFGAITLRAPALPIYGEGTFATLSYEALIPGSSTITCTPLFSNQDGFELLSSSTPYTVTVLSYATINGISSYQGRTQHDGIEITASGSVTTTAISDESGNYSLNNLKSGSYNIQADAPHYLPTCTTADINAAETLTLDALTLRGGDSNDDGVIDIADAALLTGAFGENVPPADERGDINNDDVVNIQDFSILGGNYELEGCQ